MKIGETRAKWPLSVRTVNGIGLLRNRANKFPSRVPAYVASRIIGYFVPATGVLRPPPPPPRPTAPSPSPRGICYRKDLRILFRPQALRRAAFHFRVSCGFPAFGLHLRLAAITRDSEICLAINDEVDRWGTPGGLARL